MRDLIADICVSILRKMKISVLIGYEIKGEVKCLNDSGRVYDNRLEIDYTLSNGEKFNIPDGYFKYTRKYEEAE